MKTAISSPLHWGVGLLAALGPALALAQTPDKGDTAWMLTSTALVLLMSVPALALFYGGLVRSKNMLSVLMQVFVGFSLITVLWCIYHVVEHFSMHTGQILSMTKALVSDAR